MYEEILAAQTAYYADGGHVFEKGATAMDVMQNFLTFAHEGNYFKQGDSSRGSNVSYIDYIDGLSYRQVNQYAGWMYSDDANGIWNADGTFNKNCSMPNVMSDAYQMTKDTKITWFYTTNYMAIYQ